MFLEFNVWYYSEFFDAKILKNYNSFIEQK